MAIPKTTRAGQSPAAARKVDLTKLLGKATSTVERRLAFGKIIYSFQDMAYGYAYSLLRNHELAEEAAQESFLAAWQNLPQLQHPEAFPAWFKRIVLTRSYAIGRRKRPETIPFCEAAAAMEEQGPTVAAQAAVDPHSALQQSERRSCVSQAVAMLPEGEQAVVVLFYVNEYSREEIAEFLAITPLAVKKRLASARRRMKERMIHMVHDDLHDQRPSRDEAFTERVLAFSSQFGELLRSGEPILATLERCSAAQKSKPRLQQSIGKMKRAVQNGEPLSAVLRHYPDLFDEAYVSAIAFGEEDGCLDIVLTRLAQGERFDVSEKMAAFKDEMRSRHEVENALPQVMALFPHLFKENDLRAMAIAEESGRAMYVVRRLARGVEYDSETKLQALRAEMV